MPARALGAGTTRRLLLFAMIIAVGVVSVALRYAGAAPLVGLGPTEMRLDFVDAAGLTTKNEVSYRGLEIGEVGSVRAVPGGVEVDLLLDRTAPPVPASAVAVVAPRSAIGEVYVDLRPTDDRPPFLTEGSVIPRERTRLPATALEPAAMDASVRCRESPPVDVRGAQNAPGASGEATVTDRRRHEPTIAFDPVRSGPAGLPTGAPPVVVPGLTP